MQTRLALLLACVLCGQTARAQYDPLNAISVQSKTGQFTVVAASTREPDLATNDSRFVVLDPNGLAVSCERIKQALWRELGMQDSWEGKIAITLRPATTPGNVITVLTQRVPGGWSYRLEMPEIIEPVRVVRALVSVLVLELANRHAEDRSAEVPLWLIEGLTQQLIASADIELVVPRPQSAINGLRVSVIDVSRRLKNPLQTTTNMLYQQAALTFQELSWPTNVNLDSEAGSSYRASAQLFVAGLMELNNGRAGLCRMIVRLPAYYNWQMAFLEAFGSRFPRLLDVEKWWALQVAHYGNRDLNRLWTWEKSWERLDEIIRTPVEVRRPETQQPVRRDATLERILRELNFSQQKPVLNVKLQELGTLRQLAAPELASLVDDYRRVLSSYLKQREQMDGTYLASRGFNSTVGIVLSGTLRSLNELDARRMALKPAAHANGTPATGR